MPWFVEKLHPALRLYRRLGFAEVGDNGVYLEMGSGSADSSGS
jgi:hypothetical protein